MYFSYFDIDSVTKKSQSRGLKKLEKYREQIKRVREQNDDTQPEYSLCHVQNPSELQNNGLNFKNGIFICI